MLISNYISCFFGGVFLANAMPHLVAGSMGRAFQSPFATPRGVGLSSSTINVIWGFFNLVAGYWLLCHVAGFTLKNTGDVCVAGLGAFLILLFLARHFGRFNGGNHPEKS